MRLIILTGLVGLAMTSGASAAGATDRLAAVATPAKPSLMARLETHRPTKGQPRKAAAPVKPSGPTTAALGANATAPSGQHSAISIACSKQADAKGLHGAAREKFRSACKRGR